MAFELAAASDATLALDEDAAFELAIDEAFAFDEALAFDDALAFDSDFALAFDEALERAIEADLSLAGLLSFESASWLPQPASTKVAVKASVVVIKIGLKVMISS